MDLPTALAASCDTYFYQVGNRFYGLPKTAAQPLQKWASTFGFGAADRRRPRRRGDGLLRRSAGERGRTRRRPTRELADRPALEAGRLDPARDRPEGPARHAAPDGALLRAAREGGRLVTPHLVSSVEQPGSGRAASGRPSRRHHGARPASTPPSSSRSRRGSTRRRTLANGTSAGVFGGFPVPIAGKTGTAEKVVESPAKRQATNQSWWCGYGPIDEDAGARRVCVVIENGGHGGGAAAPGGAEGVRAFFGVKATASARCIRTDGAVAGGRAGRRPRGAPRGRGEGRRLVACFARLDWMLLARGRRRSSAYGLWAVGRDHALRRRGGTRPTTSRGRSSTSPSAWRRAARRRAPSTPTAAARHWRSIFVVHTAADRARASSLGGRDPRLKRWIDLGSFQFQPSEFGKVLFVLALAGLLAERGRRIAEPRTTLRAVGLGALPIAARLRSSPTSARPSSTTAVLGASSSSAGTPWVQLGGGSVSPGVLSACRSLWALPATGVHLLKPYQADRLVGFTQPRAPTRTGRTTTSTQSKTALGAGGLNRPRRRAARRRRGSTSSLRTRPTSCSRPSPRSTDSSPRRSCSLL